MPNLDPVCGAPIITPTDISDLFEGLPLGNLNQLDRRSVLRYGAMGGLAGLLAAITPLFPVSNAYAGRRKPWRVSFRHTHTGEGFSGVYRVGNRYLPEAFEHLNYVMRDFRTGAVFPMDPRAVDIIATLQDRAGDGAPLEVLSGYRSPQTNTMLRHVSTGVARNSLHMYGQAIDFRMPDLSTSRVRQMAVSLKRGGVGYYPDSDFVHVDTGKIRSW